MAGSGPEWRWIALRLSGEISQREDALLNEWINASRYNTSVYKEAVSVWRAAEKKTVPAQPNLEEEWNKLVERFSKPSKATLSIYLFHPLSMAAAFALVIVSGILIYRATTKTEEPQITIAATDEVRTVYLPDSSKIWLNANSEITYHQSFSSSGRNIRLKGQAYFIVTPDSLNPFVIESNESLISVIGTSFDATATDSLVQVIVEEGTVSLQKDDSQITLTKGERGISSDSGLKESKNTDSQFASWRKKNNPEYVNEIAHPLSFLKSQYTFKKNQLNQTLIEGSIKNTATLATYVNPTLKIVFLRANGKRTETKMKIDISIYPGQRIFYKKRLLDIFARKQEVSVELESIQRTK
jgi:transmembrane sensor